jgi:hypothetical protein
VRHSNQGSAECATPGGTEMAGVMFPAANESKACQMN